MSNLTFFNANLLDGESPSRPGQTVVVKGNRIAAVSPSNAPRPEPGAQVIDLAGRTLMPGMVSSHLHIEYDPDFLGTSPGMRLGTEAPHGLQMAYAIRNASTLLQSGVTSGIGAGCSHNIDVELTIAVERGVVEGPRLVPCSGHLNASGGDGFGRRGRWWFESDNTGLEQGFCTGADEFRRWVREQTYRGVQMIKVIFSGGHGFPELPALRCFTNEELRAVVQAAHDRGARVRTHVVYRDMILECIDAGVDIIDHADEIDESCISAMADAGTFWVPSLFRQGIAMTEPDAAIAEPLHSFNRFCEQLRAADKAGVRIITGDDYGTSARLRHQPGIYGRELAFYARFAGIEPLAVLRWATRNGGEAMNLGAPLGVIREGALADLIVVDGDPSVDIDLLADPEARIKAIIKDGVLVKQALASEPAPNG